MLQARSVSEPQIANYLYTQFEVDDIKIVEHSIAALANQF